MLVRLPWGLRRTGAHLTQVSPAPNISHQPWGEKNAAKASLPTPTQGRPGSAQPQMETCMCTRNCTEHPSRERERRDLLIVPLSQPVCCHASSDEWFIGRLEGITQGSCLSTAIFEVRHVHQMSFYQMAIHWLFEEGLWILMALRCVASTAGLGHGDEQLPPILVNEHFLVQLSQKWKEVKQKFSSGSTFLPAVESPRSSSNNNSSSVLSNSNLKVKSVSK